MADDTLVGWELVAANRREFADVIEGLSDEQADAPSLCGGWSNRQVAGHVTSFVDVGLPSFMFAMAKSVPQGAATSCLLAANPSVAGVTGRYFSDCREVAPTPLANDEALAERLWQVSEELVA